MSLYRPLHLPGTVVSLPGSLSRPRFTAAFCLLLCSLVASAAELSQQQQRLINLAEQGEVVAQAMLAQRYLEGDGVDADPQRALYWYELAALQGMPEAQFDLGLLHLTGTGTTQDARKAVLWWRKAAEQQLAAAQYNLGLLYLQGEGVPKNPLEAIAWLERAAAQGSNEAISVLQRLQPASEAPVNPGRSIYREDWILAQATGHYTLQLSSGYNETGIIDLLSRHRGPHEAAYFKETDSRNRLRYTALLGAFEGFDEARKLLNTLPQELRHYQPWVRRFGSLQQQIRDTQQP